jgi:hypothetical protein
MKQQPYSKPIHLIASGFDYSKPPDGCRETLKCAAILIFTFALFLPDTGEAAGKQKSFHSSDGWVRCAVVRFAHGPIERRWNAAKSWHECRIARKHKT